MPSCRAVCAAVFVLSLATAAQAVMLVRLSDAELVRHSHRIAVGTVTGVSTAYADPDGDGVSQIWTTVRFRMDEVLKGPGQAGEEIEFLQMGGSVGQRELRISGMPKFLAGGRYVLFLNDRLANPKYSPLVGIAQGRWEVTADAQGGEQATRSFEGCCMLGEERPAAEVISLAELKARVEAEVRR